MFLLIGGTDNSVTVVTEVVFSAYWLTTAYPMRRLLEWLPDVHEDVEWMREQTLKILQHVFRQTSKSISQQVSAR